MVSFASQPLNARIVNYVIEKFCQLNEKVDPVLCQKLVQDENDVNPFNGLGDALSSAKMKLFGLSAAKLQYKQNVNDSIFRSCTEEKNKRKTQSQRKNSDIPQL